MTLEYTTILIRAWIRSFAIEQDFHAVVSQSHDRLKKVRSIAPSPGVVELDVFTFQYFNFSTVLWKFTAHFTYASQPALSGKPSLTENLLKKITAQVLSTLINSASLDTV